MSAGKPGSQRKEERQDIHDGSTFFAAALGLLLRLTMDLTELGTQWEGMDGRNRNLALHPSPDQKQNSEQSRAGQLQLLKGSEVAGWAGKLMMTAWLSPSFSSFVCALRG